MRVLVHVQGASACNSRGAQRIKLALKTHVGANTLTLLSKFDPRETAINEAHVTSLRVHDMLASC